jgi:alkanesulfonate monooxygenase SsuD/methylene tetrahydromethanopterin reductase-like flavin-dependent oxidoreductase (luciferase family)
MAVSIEFGFCVPIFANPGMAFFRTPCYERLDWPTTRAAALECEALGYDSLFVADHVFLGRDGAIYEGWTLLAVLAGLTRRIKLAPIHLCDSFRNPALTAKMVSMLDVASEGRFILFYDYGWRRAEFDAYGFAFERSDDERAAKMAEGLQIITGMLTEPRFSFSGRYYRVRDAICEPKCVQRPRPPIWMGEANNPVMLRAIAAHADVFNSMPASVAGLMQKLRAVDDACRAAGRDPASLGRSLETQILIADSDAAIDGCLRRIETLRPSERSDEDILAQLKATNPALERYRSRADFEQEFLIGTAPEIVRRLTEYIDLGVTHFMLWFMDFPSMDGVRLFARAVMPEFRREMGDGRRQR